MGLDLFLVTVLSSLVSEGLTARWLGPFLFGVLLGAPLPLDLPGVLACCPFGFRSRGLSLLVVQLIPTVVRTDRMARIASCAA